MHTTRRALLADLGALVTLARRARAETATVRGGALWANREARREPLEAAYEALLDHADALVLVAEVDGDVRGFGAAEIVFLHDGRQLGVIGDFYVAPGVRRRGIGTALLESLTDFCDRKGCTGTDALALPGDRAAKNLLEQSGFEARALVMHRSSPLGSTP